MSIHPSKRLTYAVLLAGLILPVALLVSQPSIAAEPAPASEAGSNAAPVEAPVAASDQETIASFKKTLADYGKFVTLAPYGEVWVPTVTPEGWHPYPPCHWVDEQNVGWYFRDDTPWGAIVHHYGRWSHDEKIGWFWVPDADWSPGWVVWRSSDKWTGWAPMPPDQEAQKVSLDSFNKDKMWIFMDTPQFTKGCGDTVVANFGETEPVSIFELPRGHIVDLRIVPRWKIRVIRRIIVVDRICPRRPNDPPKLRTLYDSINPQPKPTPNIERHTFRDHAPHHVWLGSGGTQHRWRTVVQTRRLMTNQRYAGRH